MKKLHELVDSAVWDPVRDAVDGAGDEATRVEVYGAVELTVVDTVSDAVEGAVWDAVRGEVKGLR